MLIAAIFALLTYGLSYTIQVVIIHKFSKFYQLELSRPIASDSIEQNSGITIPNDISIGSLIGENLHLFKIQFRLQRYFGCASQITSIASFVSILAAVSFTSSIPNNKISDFMGIVALLTLVLGILLVYWGIFLDEKKYSTFICIPLPWQKSKTPEKKMRINFVDSTFISFYSIVAIVNIKNGGLVDLFTS